MIKLKTIKFMNLIHVKLFVLRRIQLNLERFNLKLETTFLIYHSGKACDRIGMFHASDWKISLFDGLQWI